MTEMFCREHGMFHDSEQSDPDCVFEDGLGNAVEADVPGAGAMSDDYECCASGSCEVCRRPQGYTREQRDEIARVMDTYDPPWVLERKREDARRGIVR